MSNEGKKIEFPRRASLLDMDSECSSICFGNIEDYELWYGIGKGKYSTVFLGQKKNGKQCALKVLKPVSRKRISREVEILEKLKNGPNICNIMDVVLDSESGLITIVSDYVEGTSPSSLLQLSLHDIAFYVYKVLEALNFAHENGIVHRDVKPSNILIDRNNEELTLIDWGLADYYPPKNPYSARVATRPYKAPELLLNYKEYTTAIDIWGAGVTLLGMLFRKTPYFRGRENSDIIVKVADFVGYQEISDFLTKYKMQLGQQVLTKISNAQKKTYEKLKEEDNYGIYTPLAHDLITKMLTIDFEHRITAKDALLHPFFDCVRDRFKRVK